MLIDNNLLSQYGAETTHIKSLETIFKEGETPKHYYQIAKGKVKLNHYDEDGKEIIQSILIPGQSVCELMLFIDEKYPVNSETLTPCEIITLPKDSFFKLLDDHPQISLHVNKFIAERLYRKFVIMQHNLSLKPEVRLIGVLDYFKSYSDNKEKYSFEIDLTRKQMASLTGLRIETVIRTIKKMDSEKILKLQNSKIYY